MLKDGYYPGVECFQNICKTPWSLEGVTEVHEIIFAYLRSLLFYKVKQIIEIKTASLPVIPDNTDMA